jgi:pentatricopeptide repeat protein
VRHTNTFNAEPDEVTFTQMIKACALKGEAEKAENILHEMVRFSQASLTLTFFFC